MLDTGAHTLDTPMWLLGDVSHFSYKDDNHGGVEADCYLNLTLKSGTEGTVELSRSRILRNSAVLEGEEGTIEVFFYQPRLIFHPKRGSAFSVDVRHGGVAPMAPGLVQMLHDQLLDWHLAITTGCKSSASAAEGLQVVALIEEMYRQRVPLAFPWEDPDLRETAR